MALYETNGNDERPELVPGVRVRIIKEPKWNGPWPQDPLGTLDSVTSDSLLMTVETKWGPVREYYVAFDEPPFDDQGDGPYRAAVIWQQYIVLAEDVN